MSKFFLLAGRADGGGHRFFHRSVKIGFISVAFCVVVGLLAQPSTAQSTDAPIAETDSRDAGDNQEKSVPPLPGVNNRGFAGGITSNDFQPLMDLIQSVIKTDSWQDNGGEGTIIDYPAGVFADAAGAVGAARKADLLKNAFRSPTLADSKLRTISLNRIENALFAAASGNRPLSPELRNLAGIYRIDYVFVDSARNDVLIAGPAGPWRLNTSGTTVNVDTGLPTLKLDDLVACLINAFHDGGKFGCTIVPKPDALAAAQKFINATAGGNSGRKWRESLRDAVGKQDIIVHGVSPDSGVAQTIVEADVLMKKIGMGLEPSIDEVPDYFARVKDDPSSAHSQTLIRWWFTMSTDALVKDAHRNVFKIDGNSVKVLSENELLDANGRRVHTGVADDATAGFAADFTEHFESLSLKHPELANLKNVFDLALVANIIRRYDARNFESFKARYRRPGQSNEVNLGRINYSLISHDYAQDVDSIMNFETFGFRERGKRYRRTLVGVSGGVEFDFDRLGRAIKMDRSALIDFPRGAAEEDIFRQALPGSAGIVSSVGDSTNTDGSIWWWD